MSEPSPAERDAAAAPPEAAAPPVEPAPRDFGASLRAAREAASLTVPALAARLRLHVRQIEALERGDLAALPSLIYVRGFVRGCARELKIDAEPLLADLNRRAGVEPGAQSAPGARAFPLARFGDGSRPIIAIVIVLLVVAGIVGTVIPRRQSITTERGAAEAPAAAPRPAPPELADPAPAEAPAPAPEGSDSVRPPTLATTPAPTPLPAPRVAPAAGVPPPAQVAKTDARPLLPPVPAPGTAAAAAPAGGDTAAEPAGSAAVLAASAPDAPDLVLHVHSASWVEVVQSNGTTLLAQICAAGSVQEIKGKAPLRIVIGNAPAVDARYRGNPVDLARYANVNGVARVTLE
jgi:cytoskeleton protein RodZ